MKEENSLFEKRNLIIIQSFLAVGIINVAINVLNESTPILTKWIIGLHYLVMLLFFSYVLKTKKLLNMSIYVVIISISILLVFVFESESDLVTLIFYYMIPILSSLYNKIKVVIFSSIISCSFFCYFAVSSGKDVMGKHFISTDLTYYCGLFALIAISTSIQINYSTKAQTRAAENEKKAVRKSEESEQNLAKMIENREAIEIFSKKLKDSTQETTENSSNILAGFIEMNGSFDTQTTNIQELYNNILFITEEMKNIQESTSEMEQKSTESKIVMERTETQVLDLNDSMSSLDTMFDKTLYTTRELNQQTKEIQSISGDNFLIHSK